jgi:hypothetical protein
MTLWPSAEHAAGSIDAMRASEPERGMQSQPACQPTTARFKICGVSAGFHEQTCLGTAGGMFLMGAFINNDFFSAFRGLRKRSSKTP